METTDDATGSGPADPILEPQISSAWAITPLQLLFVGLMCIFFLILNYMPLRGTDLWTHVLWGQWILEHRQLPTSDPFQGLASGMRVVDSAWLSQVLMAKTYEFGPEWLSNGFAVVVLISTLLICRVCFLESRSTWVMILCSLLLIVVGFSRLSTIRPENLASLCLAVIAWCLFPSLVREDREGRRIGATAWWVVPLSMLVWANLHGSFVCGIIVLACWTLGEWLVTIARDRSLFAPLKDPLCRQLLILTEVSFAATLLNPYFLDLWVYAASFSSSPNLTALLEWQPLVVLGVGGREFALSWIVLAVVARFSGRRIHPGQVLLILAFSYLSAKHIRMLTWYAPIYTLVLAPHLGSCFERIRVAWSRGEEELENENAAAPVDSNEIKQGAESPGDPGDTTPSASPANEATSDPKEIAGREGEDEDEDEESDAEFMKRILTAPSFRVTLVAGLFIWMAFAFSGWSVPVLGGVPRTPERLHGDQTPLQVAQLLKEDAPQGQIYNPHYWGDWLLVQQPSLKIFATANVHLIPRQVWLDYLDLENAAANWSAITDRYRITTLVLDKDVAGSLASLARNSREWQLAYEDDQAIVFVAAPPTSDRGVSQAASPADSSNGEGQ